MDQTLVEVIGVHDEATRLVFKNIFNVEPRLTEIDYAGRSLTESFQILAGTRGIPEDEVRDKLPEILAAYDRAFDNGLPEDGTGFILPGVIQLLEELSRSGNLLVLYTGDSAAVAQSVMKATGLGRYFPYRFSGTEVATRADMVKQAIDKAAEVTGRDFKGKDIVVIGDSLRDIEAGRAFGARTISVATGRHSREQLKATNPDFLFDSLEDYQAVLRAIEAH